MTHDAGVGHYIITIVIKTNYIVQNVKSCSTGHSDNFYFKMYLPKTYGYIRVIQT